MTGEHRLPWAVVVATALPSARIITMMTTILPTLAVLVLLVGISGCFGPVWEQRVWREDQPRARYGEGGPNHSGRDCWRDSQQHCRDD